MRITSFAIFNQVTRALQERIREMAVHADRLSTGKRINKPSDDVYGLSRSMDYKVRINEMEQYMKNIDEADSQLGLTDTIMSSAANVLIRGRELALQAASDTQTASDRVSVAEEIASLRDEMLRLSQTKFRDRYIFSGYKTNTQPFDAGFNYSGDANRINVLIDSGSTLSINVTGDEAFSYVGETYFETLDNLYNALVSSDMTAIRDSTSALDNALGQVANVRADVGARMAYLERLKATHADRNTSLKMLLSNAEDTDLAGTISELTKIQYALEALRASGSKVLSQSLMDFLN